MWPTEYGVHEHRKELERSAAQIRLAREVSTQPASRLTRLFNVMRMFHFRRRRPQPVMQPVIGQALRRVC